MNLRQKYKRAKRRIEMLEDRPVRVVFKTEPYDIQTVMTSKYINRESRMEITDRDVRIAMARDMGEALLPFMEFSEISTVDSFDPRIKISARLRVAKRKGVKEYD